MIDMISKPLTANECKDVSISLIGISKRFDKIQALDGINLDIKEGTVCALLGPNGSGKTILVRILTNSPQTR
jgi:ABC-type multidrug transport system ATPase subunit